MTIHLDRPCSPGEQSPRLTRLTLHLQARLLDFAPGGPHVLACDGETGRIAARFPGRDTSQVRAELAQRGFHTALEDDCAIFYLSPGLRFEDLDRLWGVLYELL